VILPLILIGALEAAVHLWRYRSANEPSAVNSANSGAVVCLLRFAGIGSIAGVTDDAGPWAWLLGCVAYVAPVWVVTWWLHRKLERKS
jgi:hypothetical protein